MWAQDVERTLSQHRQDIISDAVVNQKVCRRCDLRLAPIGTRNTINLDEIHWISGALTPHNIDYQPSMMYAVYTA